MAASSQEKPRYTANYNLDALAVSNAASAMDVPSFRNTLNLLSVLTLVLMIIILFNRPAVFNWEYGYWVLVVICFVVTMAFGTLSTNSHRFQMWKLNRAGVYAIHVENPDELRVHIDVYDNRIVVERPASHRANYSVSDVKKFFADEDSCVLVMNGGDYVIVPRSSMSTSRYLNLIDFLDHRAGK